MRSPHPLRRTIARQRFCLRLEAGDVGFGGEGRHDLEAQPLPLWTRSGLVVAKAIVQKVRHLDRVLTWTEPAPSVASTNH
jgi:hypothetical protein